MRNAAWPAVPRPFRDEAFGGWFGRVAGRYGITVDELCVAGDIRLELGPEHSGWLAASAPSGKSMRKLASVCRLSRQETEAWDELIEVQPGRLNYCYHCLVLNRLDVSSPYWKRNWLLDNAAPCTEHLDWLGQISPLDLQHCRNLPKLLRLLERRWQRVRLQRRFGR